MKAKGILYPGNTFREIDAELARRRFGDFIRQAWHVVEPGRPFISAWHVDAIADHLQAVSEGRIKNLLINIPPGHGKSLIVSVLWPAWQWIRTDEGGCWRGLFASYDFGLAIRDSVRCRSLIESPWYRETFRPLWQLSCDQNEKGLFENTKSGSRISLSVGGRSTGLRGDAIVVDDPLNASDQFSDRVLSDTVFWWDQSMSSRLNDMERGNKIVIMQRLSERDLSGHALERGNYEHLCLPSEFEPGRRAATSIGWCDPRTAPGEVLFPALYSQKVLDQAKIDLGSAGYAGQHQQRPSPAAGGVLQRHWWRYWQPRGAGLPPVRIRLPDGSELAIEAVELPEKFDAVTQSWDLTFKDNKTSDYVVGQVLARKGASRYVLHQVRERMDMPRTVQAIRKVSADYPDSKAKLVEDKANGPAVIQSLKNEISGLIAINPEGGKMSRASAVSPELEAGDWHLPHPAIALWVPGFIEECAAFPNGTHDDQVDAWSQGANYMGRRIIEPNIRFIDLGPNYRPAQGTLSSQCFGDWLRVG
jgi:predicted phage terminase large subunit-like protein